MKTVNEKINTRAYLAEISVTRKLYGRDCLVVDVNRWGVWPYNSDPENQSIYRSSLIELFYDLDVQS